MLNIIKKVFIFLFFCILAIGVHSCSIERPIARTAPDNNETYKVDYLFEHEGCKVYRFWDNGNYVYFTNCTGNATSFSNDSTKVRIENIITKE